MPSLTVDRILRVFHEREPATMVKTSMSWSTLFRLRNSLDSWANRMQ